MNLCFLRLLQIAFSTFEKNSASLKEQKPEIMMNQQLSEKIKVSVILPVWNPGPGIDRCISTLRNQSLKEIELIFVDDLGSDDSMDKVQAAARVDKRIRILKNKENTGPGGSRNAGIEAARGEYILCVDPDDFVDAHFLEGLYKEAAEKNLDIVKGNLVCDIPDKQISEKSSQNQKIRDRLAKGYPLYMVLSEHPSVLVRRKLILEKGIKYADSRYAEDIFYLFLLGLSNASFGICDVPDAYHYVYRMGSLTSIFSAERLFHLLEVYKARVDLLLKQDHDIYAKKYVYNVVKYLLRLHAPI